MYGKITITECRFLTACCKKPTLLQSPLGVEPLHRRSFFHQAVICSGLNLNVPGVISGRSDITS